MTFRHVVTAWMSIAAAFGLTATGCGTALSTLHGSATHQVTTVGAFTLVQEPEAGFGPIRDMIAGAKASVRMSMYELGSDEIVDALLADNTRGVQTQVLLDSAFHGQTVNAAAFQRLSSGGVDVRWASSATILHQKSITIDDAKTAIGTGNLMAKYEASSRDAWVVDADPDDVSAIVATFSQDFATRGRPPQAAPGRHLVWSPAARQVFLQRIEAARHTLDVTSEEFSDRAIASALEQAVRRGVPCRIILPSVAKGASTIGAVSRAGCAVHYTDSGVGALYMHEKVLVTDGDSGDELVIGSMNLSPMSLTENRELALALDPTAGGPIIAAVESTFDKDFASTSA